VINGEKAAFNTPTFAQKRERTLDMLIKDLFSEHMNDGRGVSRHAMSSFEPRLWPCIDVPEHVINTSTSVLSVFNLF
jgi:hypothetical protein